MPNKRGRPLSTESTTLEVADRRNAWRRRQQIRRARIIANASVAERHHSHLQQGEQVVDLTVTREEEAAVTLTQLGLRVQGVTLAQDVAGAHEQGQAIERDNSEMGYNNPTDGSYSHVASEQGTRQSIFRHFAAPQPAPGQSRSPHRGTISQYFSTLPARNPRLPHYSRPDVANVPVSPSLAEPATRGMLSPIAKQQEDKQQDNIELGTGTTQEGEETTAEPTYDSFPDIDDYILLEQEPYVTPVPDYEEPVEVNGFGQGSEDQLRPLSSASEEPAVSFATHVSESEVAHNEEEPEPDSVDIIADMLYQQLVVDFHGCSEEEHQVQHQEHTQSSQDNHHGLNEVFNDPDFPSVLGLRDMITPERLAREQAPSAAQWNSMYCGLDRRRRYPQNVCLHKEETQAVEAKVACDIDSFLGFGSSLALARKGIWCQFVPQMRQNIGADVHLDTRLYQDSEDPEEPARSTLAMLRDVPHFLLGRVEGAHDTTIHVLFPYISTGGPKFVALTRDQLTRWVDQVFLPAVHKIYDADYTQHLPGSYDHAYDNSKAHQTEGRLVETASYEAQQSVGYHIQPEHLDAIWSDMMDTVSSTPGLSDFRDAQLFFSAKGTKLYFKTRPSKPTLPDVMEFFQEYFEDVFDSAHVQLDRFYVDVGKEVCPTVHLLATQTAHVGEEPQVYLRKRCCLEKYMHWMYDGKPPGQGKAQLYFTQNMLYDAASLTSVTTKRSRQREGGLIYTQMYSSVKEIVDATKRFPFTNDGMEEMALDPQIRQGARQAAGGRRRDAAIVERAYLASKRRARDALMASRQKSFGVREEHRIRWDLFLALLDRLQFEDREELEVRLADCPSYVWPIRTSVYMDFLWRSADKFATGFEVVRAQCRRDLVTWEQTKMMAMFLRCLRFVWGGHLLRRESALWWGRRESQVGDPPRVRTFYGLGFSNTLPRHGYCWIQPLVDWERLQFQLEYTDDVLFGNAVLRGQYMRHGREVRAFLDTTKRLETAVEWLRQHRHVLAIRFRLILWIVHICLQQFRIDVMQCVAVEIREEHREEALLGMHPLSVEWLDEIMTDGVYRMSGNRCDFKIVSHLGHFLFDFEDGKIRKHWDARQYRVLYRRTLAALSPLGRDVRKMFQQCLWDALYQYHWVLPYPCSNALMQTTKQGQRMWYTIVVSDGVDPQVAASKDWTWAQKGWQPGTPRALPPWLEWDRQKWEEWIEQRGG